jgi:hypothetical protein
MFSVVACITEFAYTALTKDNFDKWKLFRCPSSSVGRAAD